MSIKHWLLNILERKALRAISADKFKNDRERESARRLLATVRAFRGSMELE